MTTDLNSKAVEELLDDMNYEVASEGVVNSEAMRIAHELARRLEELNKLCKYHEKIEKELQQQIVAQQAIKTRCPSCGNQTLFISDNGELCCSWIQCKEPTAIIDHAAHDAEVAAKAKAEALDEAVNKCFDLTLYTGFDCAIALEELAAEYRAKANDRSSEKS